MAGDWIKMRASLCTHPKVLLIADIVAESTEIGRRLSTGYNGSLDGIVTSDVTRDITLASLLRVWCATNEHTVDGVWHNSTLRTIDNAAGIPGFGEAMSLAGWAIYEESAQTVTLPNFLENNAPAKNNARSTAAERQARYRDKKKVSGDVTRDASVTSQSDAREEKRREEKKNCPKPRGLNVAGFPPGFDEFWSAYPKRQKRKDAVQAFAKLKPDPDFLKTMLSAIATQAASEQWRKDSGKFIPLPASWLNGERWLDETTPTVGADPVLSELFRRGAA